LSGNPHAAHEESFHSAKTEMFCHVLDPNYQSVFFDCSVDTQAHLTILIVIVHHLNGPLPQAVARWCMSNADRRKIKSIFRDLISLKDLWLMRFPGLILRVGPTGGTSLTQSTTS
jgi:hypothetical protein